VLEWPTAVNKGELSSRPRSANSSPLVGSQVSELPGRGGSGTRRLRRGSGVAVAGASYPEGRGPPQLHPASRRARRVFARSGLSGFPAIFDDAEMCWPGDDWRAFVEVAVKAGVRLVYVERSDLALVDRDEYLARSGPMPPELADASGEAIACSGPTRVEVGFILSGVRHLGAAAVG